jgi:RsiW-degrading membrane proteinase PrsW (M82 family)
MKSVANIMMQLLQNYVKDDGKVGVDDLNRWPSDSIPVEFLSATITVGTVEELMKACASPHDLEPPTYTFLPSAPPYQQN